MLLGVPALPLPTGGATHVFELLAILLALQLIAGRSEIWLPARWCSRPLATTGRFMRVLLSIVRRVERFSRPRLPGLFEHRLTNRLLGVAVIGGSAAAFLAPPFTGLDTLPALGVVLVSLGVMFSDAVIVAAGLVVGVAGSVLVLVVGRAVFDAVRSLFLGRTARQTRAARPAR